MIWSRRQASAPFIPFIIKKVKIGKKRKKWKKGKMERPQGIGALEELRGSLKIVMKYCNITIKIMILHYLVMPGSNDISRT